MQTTCCAGEARNFWSLRDRRIDATASELAGSCAGRLRTRLLCSTMGGFFKRHAPWALPFPFLLGEPHALTWGDAVELADIALYAAKIGAECVGDGGSGKNATGETGNAPCTIRRQHWQKTHCESPQS